MSQTRIEVLSDLQREINAYDNLSTYYQNRSMAKQMALKELIESWRTEGIPHIPTEETPPPEHGHISCNQMVKSVFNGELLTSVEVRRLVAEKYQVTKPKSCIGTSLYQLTRRGDLVKEGNGWRKRDDLPTL